MRYIGLLILFILTSLQARELSFLDEAAQLGTMGGLAQACGIDTKTLQDYEFVAARLIAVKTNSPDQEVLGYQRYAEEKITAMRRQENSPQISCNEVLERFENMPILKAIVYRDGSVKLSDGTFLKSKRGPTKLNKK